MIDWLFNQTIAISFSLAFLILTYRIAARYMSATLYYALWSIIPLQLLISPFLSGQQFLSNAPIEKYLVVANASIEAAQSSIIFESFSILWVWLIGVIATSLFILMQHRTAIKSMGPLTKPVFKSDNSLPICHSERIHSPLITGLFNPTIVLPVGFEKLSYSLRSLLLKHETVHWQRKDLVWNAIALSIVAVFWFNPLVWWAYGYFRQTQELACDEAVLRDQSSEARILYAKSFLEHTVAHEKLALTSLYYGGKSSIRDRINNMKPGKKNSWILLPMVMTILSGIAITQSIASQDGITEKAIKDVKPIMRVEPKYPQYAAINGLEGSVKLSFSINTNGTVSDVEVIESDHNGLFDESAIIALEQWLYTEPGNKMNNMLVQLDYSLGGQVLNPETNEMETIPVKPQRQ